LVTFGIGGMTSTTRSIIETISLGDEMISDYDHRVALNNKAKKVKDKFISELRAYVDFDEDDVERFLVQNGYVSPPRFSVSFVVETNFFMTEDDVSDSITDAVESCDEFLLTYGDVSVSEVND
jgi:hypothetical protein